MECGCGIKPGDRIAGSITAAEWLRMNTARLGERCELCKGRDKHGTCTRVKAPSTPYYPPPEAWCPEFRAKEEGDDDECGNTDDGA